MRVSISRVFGFKGGGMYLALVALLAIGVTGKASAATLEFAGTLREQTLARLPQILDHVPDIDRVLCVRKVLRR